MPSMTTLLYALCVLSIMSTVFKPNAMFSLMERVFVGLSSGQAVAVAYGTIVNSCLKPMAAGSWSLLIPAIMGLLLYLRFFKNLAWIARIPTTFLLGLGLGVATSGSIASEVIGQTKANLVPLNSLTNIVIVVSFLGTLGYFFFTLFANPEKDPPIVRSTAKYVSVAGRFAMMVFFGAQVGNATAGRLSLLIQKFQFLATDLLRLTK